MAASVVIIDLIEPVGGKARTWSSPHAFMMPHEMIIGSLAVPAPTHPPTDSFGTALGVIEFEAKIFRWIKILASKFNYLATLMLSKSSP
jgi:hypothetical protein